MSGATLVRAILGSYLIGAGVLLSVTGDVWGESVVAWIERAGLIPTVATSVPFWPVMAIALGARLLVGAASQERTARFETGGK